MNQEAYEHYRASYTGNTGQETADYGTSTQPLCHTVELECLIWR